MTETFDPLDPEQPKGISRRTLVKGAAWAVPVLAVAAPAPAFAASGSVTFSGAGCKLPGNSQGVYKGYVFRMSAMNTQNTAVQVTIISAKLNGVDLGAVTVINLNPCTALGNPFTIPANAQMINLALLTANAPNSSNGTLVVQYSVAGGSTETTSVAAYGLGPIQGSCDAFTSDERTCINSF